MVVVVCDELNRVRQMALVYLAFALLWATLAVYLTFYVPRRLALLQRYVDDGDHKLGDVAYERAPSLAASWCCCFVGGGDSSSGGGGGDSCCRGSCPPGGIPSCCDRRHYGVVTYPHVNFKVYPTYVSRRVPVLQHYTRERVAVLVLPGLPFSGMPKSDVELDLIASSRQRKRTTMIVAVCWAWTLFCVLAPVYLLVCMGRMSLAFVGRQTYVNWILYSVFVGVVLPLFSLVLNHRSWTRYLHEITQSGRIAESPAGESSETLGTMGTARSDIEVGAYRPPAAAAAKTAKSKPPHGGNNRAASPKASPKR
jgi:hypothetical protein